MRRNIFVFLIAFCFVFLSERISSAITVTVSPSPAVVNQNVTVNITAIFSPTQATFCTIEVNFGDGSPWVDAGACLATPCNLNINHIYTTPGTYLITARSKPCNSPPTGPDPATTSITVNPVTVTASVNVTPSSIKVPRNITSSERISYFFSTTPPIDTTLSSNRGTFLVGDNIIGEVNTPLNVSVRNGRGRVSEVLTIPVSVTQRAENLRATRITYVRTFSNQAVSVRGQLEITITTEAAADFRITRLQLYFENRRAEITVKRNQPSLKAYADIRFSGSGLLQGHWEVDGRIISQVNRHLVYGRSETIETPDVPSLPTFVTGTHIVKFVITNPPESLPLPEVIYFVTAEEFKKLLVIKLISPEDKSEIDYTPLTFKWEGIDEMVTYLIEFLEEKGEKPIFSAFSKRSEYNLPLAVLNSIFSPGQGYFWRVKAFDAENNITGESGVFRFILRELASYLPGQMVLVMEDTPRGIEQTERIRAKYNLRIIEDFGIGSLRLKISVFRTGEDIFRLINAIVNEEGVVLVQPNYIFRTLAEPMSDMQNIYRILNLKKLHERYRGKGVIVAVIDTGVDTQHRDLKDRILSSENLLKDYPYKAEIHGTAVAGVIGASINGFGIEGVVPEADILPLRACRQVSEVHPEGECYTSSIAKAIDKAIEKKAKIVNMSFGSTSPDKLIIKLLEEGRKRGLVFIAPGGNMPRQKDLAFPASHPQVVAVGGMDDRGNPYPNKEIASKTKVSAPATNVLTTIPGDKHNYLSGTSMSSAAVTGILAIAIEKIGAVDKEKIPKFKGDLCQWEEELLKLSICPK